MSLLGVALLLWLAAPSPRPFIADPPKACDSWAEWNAPRAPFRVHGDTYSWAPAG